jgi:hypothetical protein
MRLCKEDITFALDVLSVHSVMIVRGQLARNPYYVEPDIFLNEFQARA